MAGNAARYDSSFDAECVVKVWAIPVVCANPAPALFQFGNDSELHSPSLHIVGKIVDYGVEGVAKVLSKVVVEEKIVGKIVEDPMSSGDESADANNHADFIFARQSPAHSRKQHVQKTE